MNNTLEVGLEERFMSVNRATQFPQTVALKVAKNIFSDKNGSVSCSIS